MSVKMRQRVERTIIRRLIRDILAAGHRIGVSLERGYDVEDMLLGSTSPKKILEAATAGDECHLFVQPKDGPTVEKGQVVSTGWVYLVLGNDGYDVVSDYTTNLEPLMIGATAVADKYAE